MPGEEDFGIAAVEAHASGRPVIAFAAGGSLDVQIDGVTGVLFHEQTVDALCDAVLRADEIDFNPATIRASALRRFDTKVFRKRITQVIADSISSKALQAQPRMDDRRMGDRRMGDRRVSTSAEPYPNDRRVNDRRKDERRTGDRRGGSRRSVDQGVGHGVGQLNGHVGKVLVGANGVRDGVVDLPEEWKTEELAKLLEKSTR
jgi:hypothetical protein